MRRVSLSIWNKCRGFRSDVCERTCERTASAKSARAAFYATSCERKRTRAHLRARCERMRLVRASGAMSVCGAIVAVEE